MTLLWSLLAAVVIAFNCCEMLYGKRCWNWNYTLRRIYSGNNSYASHNNCYYQLSYFHLCYGSCQRVVVVVTCWKQVLRCSWCNCMHWCWCWWNTFKLHLTIKSAPHISTSVCIHICTHILNTLFDSFSLLLCSCFCFAFTMCFLVIFVHFFLRLITVMKVCNGFVGLFQ